MADLFWARRPFDYAGKSLDRGQVIPLVGARNDDKLTRLGYLDEFKGKVRDLVECSECGAKFVGHDMRIGHYEKRHKLRDLTPDQEDGREEREEKMLEAVAPLYMDNTEASRR